jgi:hypothetical protein
MQEGILKTSIVIAFIFSLLAAGCSTTTYLSLTENDKEQIEQKLNDYEHDEDVGAEITISKKNGTEINGELLSVRDNTIIICQQYSATEEELANLTYPIYTIQNKEIQGIVIEGSSYTWAGIGYGALGGALIGAIVGYVIAVEEKSFGAEILGGGVIGLIVGAITGGIIGNANSTDDIILSDIPPTFELSFLKILSRYQDEEPEYLQAIE